ncbi:MAG: MoaD/ThiS family protein [Dehalococcoidales bacterium]|nr:MAG: MoaD/ThiS family protein [Dehalococcoidales bacterium]
MSVKVHIHPSLQHITDGQEVVEVDGTSVGECFDNLVAEHPGLEEWLFEEKEKLSKYIEIFVNDESAYPEELVKPVKDGDEVYILMQIAGG